MKNLSKSSTMRIDLIPDIPEVPLSERPKAQVVGSQKKIILIGDAEPHPTPRGSGKYSKDYVMDIAKSRKIKINSILLPKDD